MGSRTFLTQHQQNRSRLPLPVENQRGLLCRSRLWAEAGSGSLGTRGCLTQRPAGRLWTFPGCGFHRRSNYIKKKKYLLAGGGGKSINTQKTRWLIQQGHGHKCPQSQGSSQAVYTGQQSTLCMTAIVSSLEPKMPGQTPGTPGKVAALTFGSWVIVPDCGVPLGCLPPSLLEAALKECAITGFRSQAARHTHCEALAFEIHMNNKNTTCFGEAQKSLVTHRAL